MYDLNFKESLLYPLIKYIVYEKLRNVRAALLALKTITNRLPYIFTVEVRIFTIQGNFSGGFLQVLPSIKTCKKRCIIWNRLVVHPIDLNVYQGLFIPSFIHFIR